jgi:ankyrin repeat protein
MAHLDIHYAAQHGDLSTIRSYISAAGDLNKRGLHKFTPLHSACEAGQEAAARLLIDAGAAVDSRDVRDNSSLHRAGYYGRVPCVKLLLQEGADPTAKVRCQVLVTLFFTLYLGQTTYMASYAVNSTERSRAHAWKREWL